ncbi:GNAT family N-acetyltransferase [Bacillus testis]|uniref:GNAT family N-acetyltransferase n=1 Tax=Bacillus testis TaxID=1622072 RepID=UPI00067F69FA|nr:GNAT family N-acetyltransferase [Bacillus testis]
MKEDIRIAVLETVEELKEVQELEHLVWGTGSTPIQQTFTAAKNGGIVLGLYDQNVLAGFQYSFPGFKDGQVYLCSHLLGIHPEYRGKGYGLRLKLAQKEVAAAKGYDLITWTYDPLESVNANLNISKLGAFCRSYKVNCYGDLGGPLNHGLESDRFQVEWLPKSRHAVVPPVLDKKMMDRIPVTYGANGFPMLGCIDEEAIKSMIDAEDTIFVPIPAHFQQVKRENMELAREWRLKTRFLFSLLFEEGYAVVETVRQPEAGMIYYVLMPQTSLGLEPTVIAGKTVKQEKRVRV